MRLLEKLKTKAGRLKKEMLAISLALGNKRTPWYVKVLIGITISYALSPVDLIPDFIPVFGYLDDLILLPVLLSLILKLIPDDIMDECRNKVNSNYQLNEKIGWVAAVFIILIWVTLLSWILISILQSKK